MARRWLLRLGVMGVVVLVSGCTTYRAAFPNRIPSNAGPVAWPECDPRQSQVLLLGTFHFAQQDEIDILDSRRQEELSELVNRIVSFRPSKVAVEAPYERRDDLNGRYRDYLAREEDDLTWRNEIAQLGFRLARRLGHESVFSVDVPMYVWHDSVHVFDERFPRSRTRLRAQWNIAFERPTNLKGLRDWPLSGTLKTLNEDDPPVNADMFGRLLPLVEEDVYAGALSLRSWYDRNLRIVQNLFRIMEPDDERVVLIIGSGHIRELKHILEVTPQMCPVSAIPYLQ